MKVTITLRGIGSLAVVHLHAVVVRASGAVYGGCKQPDEDPSARASKGQKAARVLNNVTFRESPA